MVDAAEPRTDASDAAAVLTFLIADIRGYTTFTVEHGDEAGAELATRFAELVEDVVRPRSGRVIELRGDEALVVFSSARQALRAAVDMQHRFALELRRDPSLPLRVGIGLDAGEAIPVSGGFRGAALNLAARLCSLANASEVLASETVANLARKMDGVEYAARGAVPLKGFADEVKIVQIMPESAPRVEIELVPAPDAAGHIEQRLPIGGFLGSLPATPLIAREDELRRALGVVGAVRADEGRMLLLSGEPGIGKTRLAQEITLEVRNDGFLIASGRCYEPEQTVPYYPFREALATLYEACPTSVQTTVSSRWPYLMQLLPEGDSSGRQTSGDAQEEQQRLFYAVTGFVQAVAQLVPVALLLDDIHWADESSLKLLQHLARHTRSGRILLLGTYRDVEVGRQHPLERALRDLHREGLIEEIAVRRFTRDGTAALTATTFGYGEISEEFAELLHRHTEGNPFFTHEVLRALVERGDLYRANGRWERRELGEIEVPRSIRSAVGERLSHLSEESQQVIAEASVLGQTFTFDDLQGLAERSEEEVEKALEELEAAGLIRSTGRDEYGFNHALTQQVLYEEIAPRRRRRLHLAAGEAMERGRHPERRAPELAWHFLQGDDPQRALRYSLLAGDQAQVVYAHSEAQHHYQTAIELAEELENREAEAEAREKLGETLGALVHFDEALDSLRQADALYQSLGDREGERRTIASSVTLSKDRASLSPEVEARAQELLRDTEPSEGLAALLSQLASLHWQTGQLQESLRLAEQASEMARQVGAEAVLAESELRRGTNLCALGDPAGVEVLEDAVVLGERSGNLRAYATALNNLAARYWIAGDLERNLEYRLRSLQSAQHIPIGLGWNHTMVSQGLRFLGRIAEARPESERGLEIFAGIDTSFQTKYAHMNSGILCVDEGRFDEALGLLAEGMQMAESTHDVQGMAMARAGLGELDLLLGRARPVVERFESAGTTLQYDLPPAAEAYLLAGDEQHAETVIEATVRAENLWTSAGLRVRGMLHTRREEWEQAEADFEQAGEHARSTGYRLEEGRALEEHGMMLAARGDQKQAAHKIREALALFRDMGAGGYARRAERRLREIES